jgi:hypothetical protein
MKKGTAKLVKFALGGHSVDYRQTAEPGKIQYSACSISGYDRPDRFQAELTEGKYPDLDFEGCPVLDIREPLARDYTLAITMPMVSPDLDPGEVDRLGERGRKSAGEMMPLLGGAFQDLAALAQNHEFSGLDQVAPDIFVELYRREGARVGVIRDRLIIWEPLSPSFTPPAHREAQNTQISLI